MKYRSFDSVEYVWSTKACEVFQYRLEKRGDEIGYSEFTDILKSFGDILQDYVAKGYRMKLPGGLGSMYVKQKKLTKEIADRQLIYSIRHFDDTGGYTAWVVWAQRGIIARFKTAYAFRAHNRFRKKIQKALRNGRRYASDKYRKPPR